MPNNPISNCPLNEPTARAALLDAVKLMAQAYNCSENYEDIAKTIMDIANDPDVAQHIFYRHPFEAEFAQYFSKDAKMGFREMGYSARDATKFASYMYSERETFKEKRPRKLNAVVVMAAATTIERAAGRGLSYGHSRNRKAGFSEPSSGPAGGPMLDALIAALQWLASISDPRSAGVTIKPESVLSLIKRERKKAAVAQEKRAD